MKVKICGLRRLQDAELAIELGADFVGVVLAADSPRVATLREAAAILGCAQGRAQPVLVFRGQTDREIVAACAQLRVQRVQVHGADAGRCDLLRGRGLQVIPVQAVAPDAAALPTFARVPSEQSPALLDGGRGGAGKRFAWALLGDRAPHAVLLAGGIRADNLPELLAARPWGIDVSSGVESEPGVKDAELMRQLFAIARSAVAPTETQP